MIKQNDHTPSMDPVERLNSLGQFRMKLDLSRMKAALIRLNHPQSSIPSVHVAGTNGKGSTCHMVDSIASMFPVNRSLYTSPHLIDITERIRRNGEQIEIKALLNEIDHLFNMSDEIFEDDNSPTYFEMLTLAFFHLAQEHHSDLNVVEVGMGGRFDATNILDPQAVAITSISMDHEFHLGSDEVEIAREKAGIIKMSTPVVLGPVHRSVPNGWKVLGAILDVCSSLGCPVMVVCDDEEKVRVKDELRGRLIPDGRCIVVSRSLESRSIDIETISFVEDGTYADRLDLLDEVLTGEFQVPLSGMGQDSNTAVALCLSLLSLPAAFAHQKLRSGDRKGLSDLVKDRQDLFQGSYSPGQIRDLLKDGALKTVIRGRMEVLRPGDRDLCQRCRTLGAGDIIRKLPGPLPHP